MQGNFSMKEDGASAAEDEFQGRGEITDLRLQSANTKVEFTAGSIPFALNSGQQSLQGSFARKSARRLVVEALPPPEELHLDFGPFAVALGRPVAAQARGLGGAIGLWRVAPRRRRGFAHVAIGRIAGLAGGQGQRGRRGADGFADRGIVDGKYIRDFLWLFRAAGNREVCNCTTCAPECVA